MLTATQSRVVRGPNVNIDAITEEHVFKALKILRSAGRLSASPLAELDLVRLRLRNEGVHDSSESRAWMLGKVLDEIVWEHLGQIRGAEQPISRDSLSPATELELLTNDFRPGHADLESWSLVYARYISLARPNVGDLAEHLGVVRRTLERRAKRGYALLSDVLRDAEREASARIDKMPGAPAHARIQVDESQPVEPGAGAVDDAVADAEAGGTGTMAEAIIALVRDDERVLRLGADEVRAFVRGSFQNLDEYRASRIAEWSLPRYRLDERFVALSMLVDTGSESAGDRWVSKDMRFDQLTELMDTVHSPALVLLGSPGSGKSTLLRRLELELAAASVCGHDADRVTYSVPLNEVRSLDPGSSWSPLGWLAERWRTRHRMLPGLEELLAQGRVTLLLDALNEIPHADPLVLRARILELKDFLHNYILGQPGNRMVISCRSLDYSAPLSTPLMRVPQVRIEPMDDQQVKRFLQAYSPLHWQETWQQLEGSRQLEVLRSPYFLRLLSEQIESKGRMPLGRADLFTGFVRKAVHREVERENRLFSPDTLMTGRDIRRITLGRWSTSYDLPEQGILLRKLALLAYKMQSGGIGAEGLQVRIDYEEALDFLADERDEDIVRAGVSLSVLDEDPASDEVMYVHQLVQGYFAGRELARAPEPELVRAEWRADRTSPSVSEVIAGLESEDPLPVLPQTGWEETTLLAAAMTEDPESFVTELMETNLALAGRCATQADVLPGLKLDLLDRLRSALVARSREAEADIRDRIACGHVLGELGDPRFVRNSGPHGSFLLPPLVRIPGGNYPIGDDEVIDFSTGTTSAHMPAHRVKIAVFEIGQFPVTNAEWACFVTAGGYQDEEWWDGDADRAWLRGEITVATIHSSIKSMVARYVANPALMDEMFESGSWDLEQYERGKRRVMMTEVELEAHLLDLYPGGPATEPKFWFDQRFNRPSQPVVGVCWYEARAYSRWLSEQSGTPFRLPTEVEWEAAARGMEGRRFAFGEAFESQRTNTSESHVRQPTPVCVYPGGDTDLGVSDMTGNVWEWTSSAYGTEYDTPEFGYPYRADDGREEQDTSEDMRRVVHGGSWLSTRDRACAAIRYGGVPIGRSDDHGFRLAVGG